MQNSQALTTDSVYQYNFEFTQDDVVAFADATGDKNPIHLDEDYAKKTFFKKRIIHGFMAGSVFSKVFGTLFPGEGTIYMEQTMTFLRPMYAHHKYSAVFTVLEVYPEKHRARVKTEIVTETNDVALSGEALISNKRICWLGNYG